MWQDTCAEKSKKNWSLPPTPVERTCFFASCSLERGTEDWVNLLDRGGLWHISDTTNSLFYAMEDEVCKYFTPKAASKLKEGTKDALMKAVLSNEEVLFLWSMFSVGVEDDDGKELLDMLVKLCHH